MASDVWEVRAAGGYVYSRRRSVVTRRAEIIRALAGLLFLAAFPNRSFALDPNQPFSSYLQTHFTPENGLPSGIVDDIVQSRDGFLWLIVNGQSLIRFDGQHFSSFDEPPTVRALAAAPNGDLWLGTDDHLKRIPEATLNQFGRFLGVSYYPGLAGSSHIICLHVSRDGVLWVGTTAGLYRFANGSFSAIVPGLDIQRIEEASNSHILAVTSAGFIEWDGSRTVAHPEIAAELDVKPGDVFQVPQDSHGVTWFCTTKGVARRIGNSIEKLRPYGLDGHGGGPAFRMTVEGAPRDIKTVLQDELYRIGREILLNAFHHARAKKIEVEIRYDAGELRIRFRDDGIEIDPKILNEGARAGHWGLPGVRERAKLAGAQLDFWSEAGAGTEVQVTVAAAVAYATSPETRLFGLFRKRSRSHGE